MSLNIFICGVGGQGLVLLTTVIGNACAKSGVKGNVRGPFVVSKLACLHVAAPLAPRARRRALACRASSQTVQGRGDPAGVEYRAHVDLAVALLARLGRLCVLFSQLGILRGYVRFLVRFL